MEAWVGIVAVLLGSIIGGATTFIVTRQQHIHESNTEQRLRRLDAYESIHMLLSEASGQTNILNMLIIGDLGYGSTFDVGKIKKQTQPERLQMLVDFHAPFLSDDIAAMNKQLEEVVKAVTEVVLKGEKDDQWRKDTIVSATIATRQFARQADQAKQKLAAQYAVEMRGS